MRIAVALLVSALGVRSFAAPPAARGAVVTPAIAAVPTVEDDAEAEPSKKRKLLADKQERAPVRATHVRERAARARLTLRNVWTRELLAVDPAKPPPPEVLDPFLRDHFTNQATRMDPRLAGVLVQAAAQFKSSLIEVVSAYRSEKYNLMLRKKGHAVARESQHPLGHAVDFRVAGVNTRKLYRYVRSLKLGGAGYYPHTGFVHADVGRVRTWVGK